MHSLPRLSHVLLARTAGAPIGSSAGKRTCNISHRKVTTCSRTQCRGFHATRRQSNIPSPTLASPSAGYTALSERRLVSLSGPDAAKFLQGAITRSIYHVSADGVESTGGSPRTEGIYGAFLNAQGRILNDVFVYPNPIGIGCSNTAHGETESFLVEVDAIDAERLARHIKLYKLRAKFNVQLLDKEEATVWQAWGDNNNNNSITTTTTSPSCNDKDYLSVIDNRAPGMGTRFITSLRNVPGPILSHELGETDEKAYTIRRYTRGVAEGQREILRETALPQESNLDLTHGIDFRKGCYVGQELTIRTQHRGVVRKRILPVVIYNNTTTSNDNDDGNDLATMNNVGVCMAAEDIPAETRIGRCGKTGRSAGKFLRGVGNIGLALCRLEIMTDVVVPGTEGGGTIGGFNPEDEFVMAVSKEGKEQVVDVKIKAFVPEWVREGLASARHG